MPNESHAVLAVVLDESGSMASQKDFVTKGFNKFLEEQQGVEEGEATLVRTAFNHEYPPKTITESLDEASSLTEESYNPGGRTALFDAIGHTIDEIEDWMGNLPEGDQPDNVLVAIVTDGKENSSEEYGLDQVRGRIENKQDEGWEFMYIGAGLDDFSDPDEIGLKQNRSQVRTNSTGYAQAFNQVNTASLSTRRKGTVGNYQEEAEKQMAEWNLDEDS